MRVPTLQREYEKNAVELAAPGTEPGVLEGYRPRALRPVAHPGKELLRVVALVAAH